MDTLEFLSDMMKMILATVAYVAVLDLGILAAWGMSRRQGGHDD